MFLNLAFVPQMERSWAPLHNRSGLRLGKVSPVLDFIPIFTCFHLLSGSDQQLNFILTALNYSNLYDISKVLSNLQQQPLSYLIFRTFSETVVDYFSFQSKPPKKFLLRTNIVRPQWTSGTGWPSRPLGKPFMWETSSSVMDCRCQKTKAIQIDGIVAKKTPRCTFFSFSPRCTWAWLRTPCGVWSHTLRSCSHTTR